MFVVQALFDFSSDILQASQPQQSSVKEVARQDNEEKQEVQLEKGKRKRSEEHDLELKLEGGEKCYKKDQSREEVQYLSFQKGDKILVQQSFQSGWWLGHLIKKPESKGFFPSNYVKVGAKPPPPPPSKPPKSESEDEQQPVFDPEEGADWMAEKLNEAEEGGNKTLTSDYYQGITGYKYVKINENNKGILNGNYVKFDVNTGLARVPVKDQAPAAKAVRQMGYYFDYHQWNQEKNKNPQAFKGKPDPKKKKKKKLHLVGMGKDA